MSNKASRGKQRLWRGLAALTASLLALSVAAMPIVNSFRTDIDKFLGTSSSKVVTDDVSDMSTLYTFKSDYATTTELVQAIADVGERMSEEGTVLLKNNGALPLAAGERGVTLLGFNSYFPVFGGDMGSSLTPNVGTDADTVDFVQALTAKGFSINPDVQKIYMDNQASFKTEVQSWGGVLEYYNITAPSIGGVFTSKELPQARMSGWQNTTASYPVMIVMLARSAGENHTYMPGKAGVDPSENLNQTDPLGLSDDERDLVRAAVEAKASNGGKVIVLLNNSSPMEIDELKRNDGIDAILEIGLPGGYGFYGVADVLSGEVNPSGRLADTYAVVNANAPSAQNFGNFEWASGTNPDTSINSALVEAENIYIGYKYYETRYMDAVLGRGNASSGVGSSNGSAWVYENEVSYPFGYGLSYTTFTQTLDSLDVDLVAGTVTAKVTVTNTGSVAGKDVVQLYVSTPYTDYDVAHGVEKAGVQLLDYAKTSLLAPGASETVTIVADAQYMASWDSTASNSVGTTGCYILDAGDYYFALGDAHQAADNVLAAMQSGEGEQARVWTLGQMDTSTFSHTKNGTPVENQLADMDINYWMPGTATYLSRSDWAGTFPKTYTNLTPTSEMLKIMANDNYVISDVAGDVTFGASNGLTLADLKGVSDMDDVRWPLLMDQITLEECMIRTGFGGTSTKAIPSISSPEAIQNDGPNGIYSYPLGQYANHDASSGDPCVVAENDPNAGYRAGVMGNATLIAQTFSKDMAREFGEVMGNYSLWANLTIYWGAGVNIHRSPYNARNHEYYSEDAILTGYQGASFVAGGLKYGCLIAPKHFAFNDTEINRTGVAVFMTEQQARENELRGTQPSIEDAGALAVMSAYNRVGCYTDNSHAGLMQGILRGEWGFKGLMSEDFIMNPNYVCLKEAVLNGITMSCNTGDNTIEAVSGFYAVINWTPENVRRDANLTGALKQAMTWQAYALANSNAMDGYSSTTHLVTVRTWYDNAITALQIVSALLLAGCVFLYVKSAKGKKD